MNRLPRLVLALASVTLLTLASQPARAGKPIRQAGNFGLGLGAGTLGTGLSLKYFLQDDLSIQGNAGVYYYGFYYRGRDECYDRRGYTYCRNVGEALALSADLLAEKGPLLDANELSIDWAIGGGLGLGIWEYQPLFDVAAAFVLGLEFNIHAVPIDVVIEYRPKLLLIPTAAFDVIDFTGHIRYYF